MADFNSVYTLVKKQDEKIDGLLKTTRSNQELLMGIETRLASEPVPTNTPASAIPEKIQVQLPSNIATKEIVYGAVNQALKNQTDYTAQAITKVCSEYMFKSPVPSPSTPAVSDEQIRRIAQEAADKAVNKRYEKLDAAADTVLHRIYNLVHGAVWAAIPKWFYAVVGVIFLAAIGFGYGFFTQLNENSKLRDVEWLYRLQRTAYKTDSKTQFLINTEREFFTGTPQEKDSIRNDIRVIEKQGGFDKTFLYFNPSEE